MFPPTLIADEFRVWIGESVEAIVAEDIDGSLVDLEVVSGPDGAFAFGADTLRFTPTEAGTFAIRVRATDDQDLEVLGDITVVSRYRGHPNALIGLGDSVASGHGLDLADYFVPDPCWRAPNSYPRRVFNRLVENGTFAAGVGEFALLACSGYDTDDLWEREVTGGFSDLQPDDGKRSQLDWAVRTNPRFVTVTIGANDTGFVGPGQLFLEDGTTLDDDQIARRMAVIRRDLGTALDTLTQATDATIFVTNYYNPTAEEPQGTPTCRLDCFRISADSVVDAMNGSIRSVAGNYPPDRVVFVDFATPFVGKGAPNGLGPDELRSSGFRIFGDSLLNQVEDVHPYCARGNTFGTSSWINPVDCVHPDEEGTAQLAGIMVRAITDHLATYPDA